MLFWINVKIAALSRAESVCACTRVCVDEQVHMFICVHMYICVYMYTCVHTYMLLRVDARGGCRV